MGHKDPPEFQVISRLQRSVPVGKMYTLEGGLCVTVLRSFSSRGSIPKPPGVSHLDVVTFSPIPHQWPGGARQLYFWNKTEQRWKTGNKWNQHLKLKHSTLQCCKVSCEVSNSDRILNMVKIVKLLFENLVGWRFSISCKMWENFGACSHRSFHPDWCFWVTVVVVSSDGCYSHPQTVPFQPSLTMTFYSITSLPSCNNREDQESWGFNTEGLKVSPQPDLMMVETGLNSVKTLSLTRMLAS